MITQNQVIEILENLDVVTLSSHLQDGSLLMKDLEGQDISKVEVVEGCEELHLFTLYVGDEEVNTVNDSYLYNCGFGFPS